MQPALPVVKELFGNSGYRTYASALNRHPVTFHIGISGSASRISALVNLTCELIRAAKEAGCDIEELLAQSDEASFHAFDERSGLEYALDKSIGINALSFLSCTILMHIRDVRYAVRQCSARHHRHFRLIATAVIALRQYGISPKDVLLHRLISTQNRAENG